jgi:prophage regulatory protein
MADRILRRRDVEALCDIGRSTLYDWMKAGAFPKPVKLGARAVGWREGDILVWIKSRKAA